MYLVISKESRDANLIESGYLCVVAALKSKKDAEAVVKASEWQVEARKAPRRQYQVENALMSYTHSYIIPPKGVAAKSETKLPCYPTLEHYKAFEAMQDAVCDDEPEISYIVKKLSVSVARAKKLVKEVDALLEN